MDPKLPPNEIDWAMDALPGSEQAIRSLGSDLFNGFSIDLNIPFLIGYLWLPGGDSIDPGRFRCRESIQESIHSMPGFSYSHSPTLAASHCFKVPLIASYHSPLPGVVLAIQSETHWKTHERWVDPMGLDIRNGHHLQHTYRYGN